MFSNRGAPNDQFLQWATDHVLYLHVTSWVWSDPHHDLFNHRGGVGFPYVAFLDHDGHLLAQHRGPTELANLSTTAVKARELRVVAEAAAKGDAAAQAKLYVERMTMEALSFGEATALLAKVSEQLSAEQKTQVAQQLINREISELLAELRKSTPQAKLLEAAGPRVKELFAAGKVPSGRLRNHYFTSLVGHAKATKDVELAKKAIAHAEKVVGSGERALRFLETLREQAKSIGEAAGDGGK